MRVRRLNDFSGVFKRRLRLMCHRVFVFSAYGVNLPAFSLPLSFFFSADCHLLTSYHSNTKTALLPLVGIHCLSESHHVSATHQVGTLRP